MSTQGSVRKDDNGTWSFVVDLAPPGSAKRKQVRRRGFATKKEAVLIDRSMVAFCTTRGSA